MSSPGMQQQPDDSERPSASDSTTHGSSGEGSVSAMARLISQEQARIVPGAADEDTPHGSA